MIVETRVGEKAVQLAKTLPGARGLPPIEQFDAVVVNAPSDSIVAVRVEVVASESRQTLSTPAGRVPAQPASNDIWTSALALAALSERSSSEASRIGTGEARRAVAAYGASQPTLSAAPGVDAQRVSIRA